MTTRVTASGLSLPQLAQIPAIRPFQMDPEGLGKLADSVNLYRGDVTFPISLLTLPGRGGLSAEATIVYQSNVRRQVDLWNLEAPTGPLGLGWSLGYEMIAVDNRGTATATDDRYFLVAGGNSTPLALLARGAERWDFELTAYRFWRVHYYPGREAWEIVKENGQVWTYGGASADPARSAVQYGVKWRGAQGNWVDATSLVDGQYPYALAWNLQSVRTPWGDQLVFEYENDVPQVGGGQRYTRSSRLSRVTDPTGQVLEFSYGEKQFDATVREYQIPHRSPGSPALVAYQDRYETHFLDRIEWRTAREDGAGSALVSAVQFGYEVVNASDEPGNPDLYKRYLTSVTMKTADGLAAPPLSFAYYNRAEDRAASRAMGALREILYPQGGSARYEFTRTELAGARHDLALPVLGQPRFFHGPDYTVAAYYDGARRGLEVRVYTWNGQWVESPTSYQLATEISLDTLSVEARQGCFALSFHSRESLPRLFVALFHANPTQFGSWITSGGFEVLPITPGKQGLVAAGDDFVVAVTSSGAAMVRVWSPPTRSWIDRSSVVRLIGGRSYALAAHGNYFALAQWDPRSEQCDLSLAFLDPAGFTFTPGTLQQPSLSGVKWQSDSTPQRFWSLGAGFASLTYATRIADPQLDYAVEVLQWNDRFQAAFASRHGYRVDRTRGLPFADSPADGSLVGNLDHLVRYDGRSWIEGTLAAQALTSAVNFAYGSDAAVASGGAAFAVSLFDPYERVWRNANVPPPPSTAPRPSVAGSFLTLGSAVYYRGGTGELSLVGNLDPELVPTSLSNRAPGFLAYQDRAGNTVVVPIRNGGLHSAAITRLLGQKIAAHVEGPGTDLVGAAAFVTYTGPDLDQAATITLRQYAEERVEGPFVAWPVSALRLDDGYDDNWGEEGEDRGKWTRYYYDLDRVTLTPDASVTEFASAAAVFGLGAPGPGLPAMPAPEGPNGSTIFRYHNNRAPYGNGFVLDPAALGADATDHYSALAGLLFDRTDYDVLGLAVARQVNLYDVFTDRDSLEAPGQTVPLYGWYTRLRSVEDAFYEALEPTAAPPDWSGESLPDPLRARLRPFGVPGEGSLVERRRGGPWLYFPDPASHLFCPVARRGRDLVTSVAVIRRVDYRYASATGLPVAEATTNTDSEGHQVVQRILRSYAWEVPEYAELRAEHVLDAVAVVVKLADSAGSTDPLAGEPYEIDLSTYERWLAGPDGAGRWAVRRRFLARSAAAFDAALTPPVRFDAWGNQSLPSDALWRLSSEVLSRRPDGAVEEAADVQGRVTSSWLDPTGSFRYAEFTNARSAAVAYAGFEDYEELARWRLSDGSGLASCLVSGDAHGGRCSARVAPGGPALLTEISPGASVPYVLSFWMKALPAFGVDPGPAEAVVSVGGQSFTFPLQATDGRWSYRSFPVPLPGAAAGAAVELRFSNRKTAADAWFLLDDVFLVPRLGTATANVYHPTFNDLAAIVGFDGTTTRSLLDSYRRPVVDVGARGSVTRVASPYQSLPFHAPAAGQPYVYPQADPDSTLSVQPAADSPFADLVQGEQWRAEWSAADLSRWRVSDGVLFHDQAATGDAVTWETTRGMADLGVRASIALPVDGSGAPVLPAGPVGVRIGDRLEASWTPQSGWSVTLDGTTFPTPAERPFQTDWLLSAGEDPVTGEVGVLFTADGRRLFQRVVSGPLQGPVSLLCDPAGVGFHSIAAFRTPRLSQVFSDGSGKERQRQALSGRTRLVGATVYDPVGRAAIQTKTTELAGETLAYQLDFVTGFDPASGEMVGRVADAWPDDEGYPYARTEFYPSPLGLGRAQGLPGRAFAIESGHGVTYEYGTNDATFFGPRYPQGEYFVQKTVDADGGLSWALRTKLDQLVCAKAGPLPDGTYATTRNVYDAAGRLTRAELPNAALPGVAPGSFTIVNEYDFLGQQIRRSGPDAGSTQWIQDRAGQVRFAVVYPGSQPPTPAEVAYSKYDAVGRLVEQGIVRTTWDRAALTRRAEDEPDWPGPAEAPEVRQRLEYDGDGSVPTLLGRLWRATTWSPAIGGGTVQEFAYDEMGNVQGQSQLVPAFDGTTRQTSYAYDNQGGLLRLDYPDGAAEPAVVSAYDGFGRLYRLGTPGAPETWGTFRYTSLGSLAGATVPWGSAPVETVVRYNSPGWPTEISAARSGQTLFSEGLTYLDGGYRGAGYHGGQVASASYGPDRPYTYRYQFDQRRQLQVAQNETDPAASVGTGTPTAFDPDGNLTTLEQGGEVRTYVYQGDDRTQRVEVAGAPVEQLEYGPAGGTVRSSRLGLSLLEYDRSTGLTSRVVKDDQASLGFAYDSAGGRALKQHRDPAGAEAGARLYVRGRGAQPLLEATRGDAGQAAQYVYGPDGLLGLVAGGRRYLVLRDHLGSVRRVVDDAGAVVASFEYLPWGGLIRRGGSDPDITFYRFTGQEWDGEIGLYNYRARLYDPWLGRFYSVDPAGVGASPYVYVGNDPVDLTDPDGQEPLTVFLLLLAIGAAVGAAAGMITYAATHKGNFEVGKFFAYAAVGFVAGGVGAAAGYVAGAVTVTALAAAGVATSTSIASGITVGAVTGAAEGTVSSALNQIGTNLVEGKRGSDAFEGLGFALAVGAGAGAATGALLGGVTGALNARVARRLAEGDVGAGVTNNAGQYNAYLAGRNGGFQDFGNDIQGAVQATGANQVLNVGGHGGSQGTGIFTDAGLQVTDAAGIVGMSGAGGFQGYGVNLTAVCYAGRNGTARTIANGWRVPVRAATRSTWTINGGVNQGRTLAARPDWSIWRPSERLGRFETIYPSRLKTAWVGIFGY